MTNERAKRFEGEVRHRYQLAAKGVVNKRVLDIGCGLGWGAEYLAKKKAKQVLGIDRSGAAINYARQKYSCPNLGFKTLEAQKIRRLTGSFDMVVAFELIEHLPKIAVRQWITDIKQILKPGGRVMISTPNKARYSSFSAKPFYPFHEHEFYLAEFKKILKDFQIRQILGQHGQNDIKLESFPRRLYSFLPSSIKKLILRIWQRMFHRKARKRKKKFRD